MIQYSSFLRSKNLRLFPRVSLQRIAGLCVIRVILLGVPYITANMYCKSRNLPHTDIRIYSIDLRLFLRHPVTDTDILMVLYQMVAHYTMHTYGVNQEFRFVEGIWFHRKSRQIRFFFLGKDLSHTIRAQHVLSYHLI